MAWLPTPEPPARDEGADSLGAVDAAWAQDWIEDYATAWREGDADTVAQLFTEDAVYRSSPFRPPTVGREAIRAYWREVRSTQEGMQLSFGSPVVQGNRVVGGVVGHDARRRGALHPVRRADPALQPRRALRGAPRVLAYRQQPVDPPEGWGT